MHKSSLKTIHVDNVKDFKGCIVVPYIMATSKRYVE